MQKIEGFLRSISHLLYATARILFGLGMAYHGYPKLMNMAGFIENVAKMGLPLPQIGAPMAMAAELLGGILVAIGYKTRIASIPILGTMLVAAFVVHANDPFQKQEFALLYGVLALVFMAKGSGRFSLDRDHG